MMEELVNPVLTDAVMEIIGVMSEKHAHDWEHGLTHDFGLNTNRCAKPIFRAVEEMLERSLDLNDMCEVQEYFVDRASDYYERKYGEKEGV